MFGNLTDKLHRLFRNLRGYGVISERHLAETNVELREALLAADVHHTVVATFIQRVEVAVVGQEVVKGLSRQVVSHALMNSH